MKACCGAIVSVLVAALTALASAVPQVEREPIGPVTTPSTDVPPIGAILDRMAQVASLYVDHALSFTAEERTTIFSYFRGHESVDVAPDAVYCFITTPNGRLDDRRVDRQRMAELRRRLAAGDDITDELRASQDPLRGNRSVPYYALRPYAWIVLFSREAQERYRYRVVGTTRKGIWISFEPSHPDPEPMDWYGDVLIDPGSFQIIRAQGYQHESVEETGAARALLEADGDAPADAAERTFVEAHVVTEFERRAHGLRLPSKVETRVYHHIVSQPVSEKIGKRVPAYVVVQKFKKYEFFGVDTRERIGAVTR